MIVNPSTFSTKTDFYIGRGKKARWIGSCVDGNPPCDNGRMEITAICMAKKEKDFIKRVNEMLDNKSHHGVHEDQGWMWNYDDSTKTNFIYVFSFNTVKCSCYGSVLFNPFKDIKFNKDKILEWPKMVKRTYLKIVPKNEDIRIKG